MRKWGEKCENKREMERQIQICISIFIKEYYEISHDRTLCSPSYLKVIISTEFSIVFIDALLPINGQAYSLQPKGAWWLCLSFHIEGPQPPQSHTVPETPVPLRSRWNSQSLKKRQVEMSTISPFFHTSKLRGLEMSCKPPPLCFFVLF